MELPKRKSPRLKGYDYSSPGGYFITICVKDRRPILGHIVEGGVLDVPRVELTGCGEIVKAIIEFLPYRFNVKIEKYVIMPDHIHMMIVVGERAIYKSSLYVGDGVVGAHHDAPETGKRSIVSKLVGFLKATASKEIKKNYNIERIWQRSYYDRVIRGDEDYGEIWKYIENNPFG